MVDLTAVAALLRISDESIAAALIAPAVETPVTVAAFTLEPGDQIVFTGEVTRPRDTIEAGVPALGLEPT